VVGVLALISLGAVVVGVAFFVWGMRIGLIESGRAPVAAFIGFFLTIFGMCGLVSAGITAIVLAFVN
jgi:hypothetical protein